MAKVSIIGVGMASHSGVAAKMFSTLANEGVNIMMISTSEIKISCVIQRKYTELAVSCFMTRLVWKRKNNWITISPNQLKGIVAVCLILVIIPFFHLFYLSRLSYEAPDYTEQFIGAMAVEIIQEEQKRGNLFS